MNEIQTIVKTMSSREIAELTGKEISHVHRDVRAMLDELRDDPELDHVREDKDARGYTECFHLTKNLSMTLVAGYNVKLRKTIIDRWQELEQQAAMGGFKIPGSMAEALRLAADLSDKVQEQSQALAIAAPKVEALERIAVADGAMCITNAAKALQQQPKAFFRWLQEHRWIYRRTGGAGWLAYQPRIQQGLLDHKVTTVERSDGTSKMVEQVLVTPKGLTKLAQIVGGVA